MIAFVTFMVVLFILVGTVSFQPDAKAIPLPTPKQPLVSEPPICLTCGGFVVKRHPTHEHGICTTCKSFNFIEMHT